MTPFPLELVPCLVIGAGVGRRFPGLPARLSGPLIRWGIPFTVVGLLLRSPLEPSLLLTATSALLGIMGALTLIRRVPPLRRLFPLASLQLACITGNTAYWGLPITMAMLPPASFGHAIAYDLVGTLLAWSLGPLLLEGIPARPGTLLATLRSSPASQGLAGALLLQLTPWSPTIASLLWWPSRLVILLALTLLGMRLGLMMLTPSESPASITPLRGALAVKLVLFPALMLLLASALRLPPQSRNAVVLQAAAPTAISVLLLAEAARKEVHQAAGMVLWSTLLALGSVTLWVMLLNRLAPG